MREYRQQKKASTSIDETKITNKETRTLVNNLLKTIEQRIIEMVNQQKISPVQIHFESPILKNEIQTILVDINNMMSNEQVLDAFEENEIKNPKSTTFTASRDTFKRYLDKIQQIRGLYFDIDNPKIKVYNDFEFLRDSDKILKIIKDNFSSNSNTYSTTVNAISATLGRLNHYQDLYKNVYMPLNTTLAINKKEEQKNKENILAGIAKSKYALLKNEGDLVEKERKKLEEVYKVSPKLGEMHKLKEEFREVFEKNTEGNEGLFALSDWIKKAMAYFPKSCTS